MIAEDEKGKGGEGWMDSFNCKSLRKRAEAIEARGVFLGGPISKFEAVGRNQLSVLLSSGLCPSSDVLEVGAGCFRCGWWLIHFLEPESYHAIEPNQRMTKAGKELLVGEKMWRESGATVNHNGRFDFGIFDSEFDFVVSRSVWTHAAKNQIQMMLDQFIEHGAEKAKYVTSYIPTGWKFWTDYRGDDWHGQSHESERTGCIRHRERWVHEECDSRGLSCEDLGEYLGQHWLRITKEF